MAQKRDKEETELEVPENVTICNTLQTITPPPPQFPATRLLESSDRNPLAGCDPRISSAASPEKLDRGALKRPREVARCSGSDCRKRVGLMGFRCRCGEIFCSEHRYTDRHDCSYDYKAAGRNAIARENPVIRPAKLLKV